ncbi:MAG: type II toxin-antitoxin system VapC family toxin [Synergistaceae bacterium]|jgi:tRNA(fMet)-specific endonuclease VapC|nr:type II toxin-antitoxin system VapC family toxin [Synergistaceae bacterium]
MSEVFMLDTDICSYILKNHPRNLQEIFKTHCRNGSVCLSVITYAELMAGAKLNGSSRLQEKITDFTALLEVADWTPACARHYASVRADMLKSGTPIGNMDMLIAAAALAIDATLVTNNEKHFCRVPGLKITNWL